MDEIIDPNAASRPTFEARLQRILRGWNSLLGFLAMMALALVVGPVVAMVTAARGAFRSPDNRALLPRRNPLTLRRYGDSLLTQPVEIELNILTVVLVMVFSFELFAWTSLWRVSGVGTFWAVILSLCFSLVVVIVDRAILTMDDRGGSKRWAVILGRVALLLGISFINSVPVELAVFSPEINQVIEQNEKTRVDAIRAAARDYEIGLAQKRLTATSDAVSGQTEDITDRRTNERTALLKEQDARRADIVRRLESKSQQLADEVALGVGTGLRGDGPAAKSLRVQEQQLRDELKDFDAQSRQQLADFDGSTEGMRSSTAKLALDDKASREAALDEKLHAIEVMPADELAKAYGGSYLEPKGFMARYRILHGIVGNPFETGGLTVDQAVEYGCREVMIFFGMMVLFLKYTMLSPETRTYFSSDAQVLARNPEALRSAVLRAQNGDDHAVGLLRKLARQDPEIADLLHGLGYNAHSWPLGWNDSVRHLHSELQRRRARFLEAYEGFQNDFRELCRETRTTDGALANLSRRELVERSERLWRERVSPVLRELEASEQDLYHAGIDQLAWVHDPRDNAQRGRLWNLSDDELGATYGWINPQPLTVPATIAQA